MTKLLYMDNIEGNYIKEFYAKILKRKENYVLLDQTAFYPLGGGQPSDTGYLEWDKNRIRVREVIKKGEAVCHILDGELPEEGEEVHGVIDWDVRYAHMKMHTAQHIISGIVFDKFNARTVGNQIHASYSRVDFYPINFKNEDLEFIKEKFNEIVSKNIPVKIYYEDRSELEKRVNQQRANLDLLPRSLTRLRIVEIEGFDICPCAGTHVRNTGEIPKIESIKRETKGKDRDRIIYSLQN